MDLVRADPLLPLDRLAGLLREAILPSVESLIDLKSQGTIVTGGYPMGHRSIVFVMQAESEEELYEILKNLPLWTQVEARATPLQRFEELQGPNQSAAP